VGVLVLGTVATVVGGAAVVEVVVVEVVGRRVVDVGRRVVDVGRRVVDVGEDDEELATGDFAWPCSTATAAVQPAISSAPAAAAERRVGRRRITRGSPEHPLGEQDPNCTRRGGGRDIMPP
jgi:hypothetical protein